jgi:hypothetical protein
MPQHDKVFVAAVRVHIRIENRTQVVWIPRIASKTQCNMPQSAQRVRFRTLPLEPAPDDAAVYFTMDFVAPRVRYTIL